LPPRRLDHFLVLTDDIDATRDFYSRALGLESGERPPLPFPGHWLYVGDTAAIHVADRTAYAAHASEMGIAVEPQAGGPGPVDHVAFGADDYEEVAGRLERAGVEVVTNAIPDIGLRQLFFEDPNGVRIEINVMPGQA
jgi:catechol 2,3-dioxygenase-like lactoylglutathione lyase family enzyme